jgi:methylmalonyl-CoA mutase C-terminal domain/subunit
MAADRIVVGSVGDDSASRMRARRLRDAGHEIVFVGGGQSPEQLASTAVAEDAVRVVVDADPSEVRRLEDVLRVMGADDVIVEPVV